MKWISVEDRLPEEMQWYLTWQEDGLNIGPFYLVFDEGKWFYSTPGVRNFKKGVTHWLEVTPPDKE